MAAPGRPQDPGQPVDGGWLADPVECGPAAGLGLYLHVPDALRPGPGTVPAYLAAVRTHLDAPVPGCVDPTWCGGRSVSSVFVGGLPGRLDPADLAGLLEDVRDRLELADDAEVTVELDPREASSVRLGPLVEAGVTRVSVDAGSLVPEVLATLGRRHAAGDALEAVRRVRSAGIAHVDVSLVYGSSAETADDWERSLVTAAGSPADHITVSARSVGDRPSGAVVDEDVLRERFERARTALGDAGFDHYEISSLARGVSARSAQVLLYARHGEYLGVGAGAHGHVDGCRWWMHVPPDRYVGAVADGDDPVAGHEVLGQEQRAMERLLLGLGLREGLDLRDVPPVDEDAVDDAVTAGLVEVADGRLRCTPRSWFLLDEAVRRLT